jgi:SEC-C motif-containing protein
MKTNPTLCPCGSTQNYANCCEPFHLGKAKPETAEKLMRSRYSAYVVGNIEYIDHTNDPSEKESFDREAALEWSQSSEWLGLEIVATSAGLASDSEGEVEFNAKYKRDGKEYVHHEVSLFKKVGPQWYYIDGKDIRQPERRTEPKVGRNDPCSCGSGKKFKKCCAA